MKFKEMAILFIKGLSMGIADIIPGVSGGTIALITGIYERFILAIKSIRPTRKIKTIDLGFLLPLAFGISMAFLAMSRLMEYLLTSQGAFVYSFFFGLILASAGFIYKQTGGLNLRYLVSGAVGFIFSFLLIGLGTLEASHSLPVLFGSGLIAICAMMLPGISGAFILLMLGQYEYMLSALNALSYAEIAVFLAGGFVGLVTFSRVIAHLLKKYEKMTLIFLTGLMLGGLRLPYNKMAGGSIPLMAIFLVLGVVIVIVLEKKTKQMVQFSSK